jgi:hypothetical protein
VPKDTDELDEINQHSSDIECLLAQQHTLLWNEDKCLEISPGQDNKPLGNDSWKAIVSNMYLGQARTFKTNVKVTPVTPQHILYTAMKVLRLRVSKGLYDTFRCVGETEHITKGMTEDKEYLESCIEKNLSFLKSIPNSVQYWQQRKQDVFAMIRQLGKPPCS